MPETLKCERRHWLVHRIDRSRIYFEGSADWKLSWNGPIGHLHVAVNKPMVDLKCKAFVAMFDGGDVCDDCRRQDMKPGSHETM